MPTVVTRAYSNPANAQAASEALKSAGFSNDAVHVADAGGQTTVSVRAEFGEGQKATRILDSHGPVAAPATAAASSGGRYGAAGTGSASFRGGSSDADDLANEPAPFSKSLGLPLLSHNPAPFSSMFGWKTLSDRQTPSVQLQPNNPAPLSALFHLPVLTQDKTASVELTPDDPAPLSKALGLKTLTPNNPAPFSAKLGLPVLTRDSNATITPATIIPETGGTAGGTPPA